MLNNRNSATRRRVMVGSAMPLMAEALGELLSRHSFTVVGRHTHSGSARDAMLADFPELAVLDFSDDSPSGVELLRELRSVRAATQVILFCADIDGIEPVDAVELGVDGLLLRSASLETVLQCVETVASGGQWLDPQAMKAVYDQITRRQVQVPNLLTRRERDVALLVATGQRNRVIAERLGISEGTVKMHLHNVYAKMGLESRTQLAMDGRLRAMA